MACYFSRVCGYVVAMGFSGAVPWVGFLLQVYESLCAAMDRVCVCVCLGNHVWCVALSP